MLKKIILFIAFTAFTLQADYLMQYNMDGEVNTFLYKDANHAKLITHKDKQGGSSAIYSLNKKVYVVTDEDGMLSIVDTQKAKSFMDSMGINIIMSDEEKQENRKFTIKKTGKKELVAGIKGDVWILGDKGEQTRVVVTNNKNIVKMTHNMTHLLSKMSGSEQNFYEIKKGYVLIKAEGMKLEKFTKKKVAKSEYMLPKKASSKKRSQRSGWEDEEEVQTQQQAPHFSKSCYENICCGKVAGEAIILSYLPKTKGTDYELIDSATCTKDKNGNRVEAAVYETPYGAPMYVTLNFHDKSGGIIKSTKQKYHNYEKYMKEYTSGRIRTYTDSDSYKYYYAVLLPYKQERVDILMGKNRVMTFTRPQNNRSEGHWSLKEVVETGSPNEKHIFNALEEQLDKNGDVTKMKLKPKTLVVRKKYKTRTTHKVEKKEQKADSLGDSINKETIDKAADLLKSFF